MAADRACGAHAARTASVANQRNAEPSARHARAQTQGWHTSLHVWQTRALQTLAACAHPLPNPESAQQTGPMRMASEAGHFHCVRLQGMGGRRHGRAHSHARHCSLLSTVWCSARRCVAHLSIARYLFMSRARSSSSSSWSTCRAGRA